MMTGTKNRLTCVAHELERSDTADTGILTADTGKLDIRMFGSSVKTTSPPHACM